MRCEECKGPVSCGDVTVGAEAEVEVEVDEETGELNLDGLKYTLVLPRIECGTTKKKATVWEGLSLAGVNGKPSQQAEADYEARRSGFVQQGQRAIDGMNPAIQKRRCR